MSNQNLMHYIRADARPSDRGPGDRYTFLVTGAQSGGAYREQFEAEREEAKPRLYPHTVGEE